MKNVKTTPEFAALSEEEINQHLDAFEAQFPDDEEPDSELESDDPIVNEVARLIAAFQDRLDELCQTDEDWLTKVSEYAPEVAIEKVAYDIFHDAFDDALNDMDFADGDEASD